MPFATVSPVSFGAEQLSVRLLTWIGTTAEGRKCSGPGGVMGVHKAYVSTLMSTLMQRHARQSLA